MPQSDQFAHLALGTAQFGNAYGIVNTQGQVQSAEVQNILRLAKSSGIRLLDTAISYGKSETVLGEAGVQDFRIVTKLPPIAAVSSPGKEAILRSIDESMLRLRIPSLYGILLHRPADLKGSHGRDIAEALSELKRLGKTQKIGISIYDPAELDELYNEFSFDIVQCPLNVLDRRLITSGWLEKLKRAGVEIHARSVFLQGLLLTAVEALPGIIRPWKHYFEAFHNWTAANGCSALAACLAFARSTPGVSEVIIGVENSAHLLEVRDAFQANCPPVPEALSCPDENLINPTKWKTQ